MRLQKKEADEFTLHTPREHTNLLYSSRGDLHNFQNRCNSSSCGHADLNNHAKLTLKKTTDVVTDQSVLRANIMPQTEQHQHQQLKS